MADLVPRASLLPAHAKRRELAISAADAAVEDRSAAVILAAGGSDIAQVPAAYLPARAEARSVDVWDPQWPEAVQRATIVAAPDVHRHKGSVYAVKAALSALNVDATITEWWQTTPKGDPYTFTVRAYARARLYDGPLLDARLIRVVYASVLRTKPHSRAFDLKVGAAFTAPLGLAPAAVIASKVRVAALPRVVVDDDGGLGLAPVAVGRVRIALAVVPTLPPA